MNTVYLGIGSNLGDRLERIHSSLLRLTQTGLVVRKVSSIYETEPVSPIPQGSYLNCVVRVRTPLSPLEVLDRCQSLEAEFGRIHQLPGEPRPLDLDILLFGQIVLAKPRLTIPHPRMAERRFVLTPMAEAFPGVRHPVSGKQMRQLVRECADPHRVVLYCKAPVLSL